MKDYGYYRYGRTRSYRRPNRGGSGFLIPLAIFAIFIICIIGGCAVGCQTGTATFTVQEKGVKRSGSGSTSSDKYLIYTDGETFEDTDSHLPGHWKTDSSDLYGRLKVGHTYTCSTLGTRISLFSSYRNLIKCQEVSQ